MLPASTRYTARQAVAVPWGTDPPPSHPHLDPIHNVALNGSLYGLFPIGVAVFLENEMAAIRLIVFGEK